MASRSVAGHHRPKIPNQTRSARRIYRMQCFVCRFIVSENLRESLGFLCAQPLLGCFQFCTFRRFVAEVFSDDRHYRRCSPSNLWLSLHQPPTHVLNDVQINTKNSDFMCFLLVYCRTCFWLSIFCLFAYRIWFLVCGGLSNNGDWCIRTLALWHLCAFFAVAFCT